ncbi:MAG: hypothetical protein VX642_00085 [Bdellovibrionota bacterium]|nr:hypothetical protein [Bdellovibrionota bacterium]
MSFSAMEREIHKLLRDIPDRSHIADELIKKWHRGILSPMEAEEVANFLFRLGMHKSLASEIYYQFTKKKALPIRACLRLFNLYFTKENLSNDMTASLYLWSESENQLRDLIRMNQLVENSEKLSELKDLSIREDLGFSKRDLEKQSRALEAHFINEDYDLAQSALEKMKEFYPDSQELRDFESRLEFQKALSALKNSENIANTPIDFNLIKNNEKNDQKSIEALIQIGQTQPEWKYDIAIALYAMSEFEKAISILENLENVDAKLFLIKVLIESRRFLESIDYIESLQKDPTFSQHHGMYLQYNRAICLKEIGQDKMAIAILKDILNVKPDYLLAKSLLGRWEKKVDL